MRVLTRILSVVLPALILSCSGHKDRFILRGTAADIDSATVLVTGMDSRFDRIDTILIEKGKFTYQCDVDTTVPILLIFQDGRIEPIFADKQQTTSIFIDSIGEITVNGSVCDQQYRDFIPAMMNDTTPEQICSHIDSFITLHPFSEVTPYLIYRYGVMQDEIGIGKLSEIVDRMSGQMKENIFISSISSELNLKKSGNIKIGQYSLQDTTFARYALGGLFEQDNVLLYVWASWNESSRLAADTLKAIESKRDRDLFAIAGISIDTDRQRWKTAVMKDSTDWNQYNDPAGWNGKVVNGLHIKRLPYFILLDKNHDRVIASGENLDEIVPKLDANISKTAKDKKKSGKPKQTDIKKKQ